MRLRHIHLPSRPRVFPPYALAAHIQEGLRRALLDAKDASPPPLPLSPTVLSFTPLPTYTLGRRQVAPLAESELSRLQAPLSVSFPSSSSSRLGEERTASYRPAVLASPRGGLTTYHGPGQVVLWAVADLRSSSHARFSVRAWARALETATVRCLGRFGIAAFTTDDPGVWVAGRGNDREADGGGVAREAEKAARKIAALGVSLRRHVSALGVAVNVDMPEPRIGLEDDVDDEAVNPWQRFVPCGLEGKPVTSVAAELRWRGGGRSGGRVTTQLDEKAVADAWAVELAGIMGVDGVEEVAPKDVRSLLRLYGNGEDRDAERNAYLRKVL